MQIKGFYSRFRNFSAISALLLLIAFTSASAQTITITVDSTKNVTCTGLSDGSAYITVTGDDPGFTYLWSNGSTDEDATGLQAGIYTVTVTDAVMAVATETVSITEPSVIGGVTDSTNITCNGLTDGTATIAPSGGTAPYYYSWSPGNHTTQSITGLSAGTYTVEVTDTFNCPAFIATVTIIEPAVFSHTITPTNVSCNGFNDGNASVIIDGGTSPYTYAWSPSGGTDATATGLSPDTYTISITDQNACTYSASVTITEPSVLTTTISSTNVNCNGINDGTATIITSGGTAAYTYAWAPSGGTDATATGLGPNTYTVTVTDNRGCTATNTATITQPALLTTTISSTNITCNGLNNGTATVVAAGGTTAYTYAWAPSGGNAATATGLAPNTYTVTVTDNKGCTSTKTATITQPALLTTTISSTNITCNGLNNGTATVVAAGGTTAYTYAWAPSGGNAATATGLAPNTYTVTVTDNKGCTSTKTATITQPALLTTTISSTNLTCNGINNGTATVVAAGGTTAYTYAWAPSGGINATATGLAPNTYTVTVTDNRGCTSTKTATITQPTAITLTVTATQTVTCNGGNNGSAGVVASGGAGGYTYSWTPSGGTNATASNLSAGTYTVTVRDANTCTRTGTVIISQPTAISISNITSTQANCGQADGTTTITASGGTGTLSYSWVPSGGTNANATGLTAGDYTVTITDENSCVKTGTVSVANAAGFAVSVSSFDDVSCNGVCDGAITTSLTSGTSPFTYNWSDGSTTSDISGLCDGVYTVTVTDGAMCVSIISQNITEPDLLVLNITGAGAICQGQSLQLTASATGGNGGYTYTWNPGGATTDTLTVSPTITTSYTLTGTDTRGCTAAIQVATVIINQPLAVVPGSNSSSVCIGSTAIISAGATGGDGNYSYSWSPGGQTSPTITVSPTVTTIYSVTVTDNCGSSPASRSYTLTINTLPVAGFTVDDSAGCAPHMVNLTNTSSPLGTIWTWNLGDGTSSTLSNPIHTYTTSGQYSVTLTVTDGNGCSNTTSVANLIDVYANPSAAFTIDPASGSGLISTNFTFTSTSTGITKYKWYFGDAANSTDSIASTQFTYGTAGSYTVTLIVENANGCSDTATAVVTVVEEESEFFLEVPNSFSPNGDGLNDIFRPAYLTGYDPDSYQLFVYSRWGALIFYSEDINKGWDGKASWTKAIGKTPDEPVKNDFYLWIVSVKDLNGENHVKKGTVIVGKDINPQ